MAYVAALCFLPAMIFSYLAAIMFWDGLSSFDEDHIGLLISLVGIAFGGTSSGNVPDHDIAAAMTVTSAVACFAVGWCSGAIRALDTRRDRRVDRARASSGR